MDEKGEDVSYSWMEDGRGDGELSTPITGKRKYTRRKKEFCGWGSRPLIEFLGSIGKYSGDKLSQDDVTAIINGYVKENGLIDPVRKKRVLCDDRLHSLFGRKKVGRLKIYSLLEAHFAENIEESSDELDYWREDDDQIAEVDSQRQLKISKSSKKSNHKVTSLQPLKSSYAAIVPENIKLVYLKGSLVLELLKEPESFETKVVGSFVRVKSDPNDYSQNSHQLLLVTGVEKPGSDDSGREIILQVSNFVRDVTISMLSNENFTVEECEVVQRKIKEGLLKKRPTVSELEEKALSLHQDITKHWIVKEIALLKNLISRANEKGWRRELNEYLERREKLENPSEQSRLLNEIPKVIAEDLKSEDNVQNNGDNVEENICGLPDATNIVLDSKDLEADVQNSAAIVKQGNGLVKSSLDWEISEISYPVIAGEKILSTQVSAQTVAEGQTLVIDSRNDAGSKGMEKNDLQGPNVIELSSDDEDDPIVGTQIPRIDPESVMWLYRDPQGVTQGPFSLTDLKRWSDERYFQPGFKVWKRDQSPDDAVLLSDLLLQ